MLFITHQYTYKKTYHVLLHIYTNTPLFKSPRFLKSHEKLVHNK
jgi:hypothetical protein